MSAGGARDSFPVTRRFTPDFDWASLFEEFAAHAGGGWSARRFSARTPLLLSGVLALSPSPEWPGKPSGANERGRGHGAETDDAKRRTTGRRRRRLKRIAPPRKDRATEKEALAGSVSRPV